jgi:xylose dehydrogenase (NAD/NADP)
MAAMPATTAPPAARAGGRLVGGSGCVFAFPAWRGRLRCRAVSTQRSLRWGILGTGRVLQKLMPAFRLARGAEVLAVASRDGERARATAQQWGIARAHAGYEALLADPEVDVVLNALHNGLHCEWTVRALRAGKHVLCEKPLGCSVAEVEQMFAAARAHRRWLMEAFMYRFHPQIAEAGRRIAAGELGEPLHIRAQYMSRGRDRKNPRYRKECGGGALLDVGCYCVNLLRCFAGREPARVFAQARWDAETEVDLTLAGVLEFDGGFSGHFVCSLESENSFGAEVIGTEGKLWIPHPWLPPVPEAQMVLQRAGRQTVVTMPVPDVLAPFAMEIEAFGQCVREDRPPLFPPATDAEPDSLGNIRVMEALLESARTGKVVRVACRGG